MLVQTLDDVIRPGDRVTLRAGGLCPGRYQPIVVSAGTLPRS
jgi:hypothetical protein